MVFSSIYIIAFITRPVDFDIGLIDSSILKKKIVATRVVKNRSWSLWSSFEGSLESWCSELDIHRQILCDCY